MHNELYSASFLFHNSLNDFLPKEQRTTAIHYAFKNKPSVKDAFEAIGIPHVEVGAVLINNKPVSFDSSIASKDSIEVFPNRFTF